MQAIEWFRKAAERGFVYAQINLGAIFESGEGVPKDEKEACEWYWKAARQGHAGAQSFLGMSPHYGEMPKDENEARQWFEWCRSAAIDQAPSSKAQYNLGVSYEFGKGVEKDLRQALLS